MQSLFDPHVDSIMRKIREQLDWMQANGVTRPIVRLSVDVDMFPLLDTFKLTHRNRTT